MEWERRVFKAIGEKLMKMNMSIYDCFDLIDTDATQTISKTELEDTLAKLQLNWSDRDMKMFIHRIVRNEK